jgi:hypothetical protein
LRRHFWLKPKAIPFVGDFSWKISSRQPCSG